MRKLDKIIIVAILIISVVIGIAYVYVMPYSPLRSPPRIEITGGYGNFELDGLYYIYANMHNHGGKGKVTIEATVFQGGDKWIRRETVPVFPGETKDLEFTFGESTRWGPEISIDVTVYWVYW